MVENDGCPVCGEQVHLLPGHMQDDFKIVHLKLAKRYGCRIGIYHTNCFDKIKYGEIKNSENSEVEVCV